MQSYISSFLGDVCQTSHMWSSGEVMAQWCERSPPTNVSRTRRRMWVEFVVGSLPFSERFFSGYSGFPLSSKTNISKFRFDLELSSTLSWASGSGDMRKHSLYLTLNLHLHFFLDNQNKFQMLTLFSCRLVGVPWRYTNMTAVWSLCKFAQNISKNIWRSGKHTDLKLETCLNHLSPKTMVFELFFDCVTVQPKKSRRNTYLSIIPHIYLSRE